MEATDYKDAIAVLGYSRRQWARITRTATGAVQRRAEGKVKVPGAEAILLDILQKLPALCAMLPPEERPKKMRRRSDV